MSEAVPSASTSRSSPRIVLPADMSPAEIVQAPAKVASPFQVTKHKKDAAKQWDLFYKVSSLLIAARPPCTSRSC